MASRLRACGKTAFVTMVTVTVMSMVPGRGMAQDNMYGPRFELGGGILGSSVGTGAAWASDVYGTGSLNAAFRVFRGLTLEGGIGQGIGPALAEKTFQYEENTYVVANEGPYLTTSWYGLRYAFPLETVGMQPFGISYLHIGAGVIDTEFGIKSSERIVSGSQEVSGYFMNYRAADASGKYAMIAVRWRLDTILSLEPGTWVDAIGIDFGARYCRYDTIDTENEYLDHPSDFTDTQLFINGLLKFDLFY